MRKSDRPQPALGLAIRQLRDKRGVTQVQLGDLAGLNEVTLSFIENGHANPTWATVRDIAKALGVSMGELIKVIEKHEG